MCYLPCEVFPSRWVLLIWASKYLCMVNFSRPRAPSYLFWDEQYQKLEVEMLIQRSLSKSIKKWTKWALAEHLIIPGMKVTRTNETLFFPWSILAWQWAYLEKPQVEDRIEPTTGTSPHTETLPSMWNVKRVSLGEAIDIWGVHFAPTFRMYFICVDAEECRKTRHWRKWSLT